MEKLQLSEGSDMRESIKAYMKLLINLLPKDESLKCLKEL